MPDRFITEAGAEVIETVFSEAPLGIALIGLDGRFLRVNRALCEMLGRTEDEIVGSTSAPFTHPDDLGVTAEAFTHLNASTEALEVEKRYVRPDGGVVWASTKGTRITDEQGRRFIVSHFKDITATRIAERLREEAQAQFEVAFSAAPNGMAIVSLDGDCLKVNTALAELVGTRAEQLLGRRFRDLFHPDDAEVDSRQRQRLLDGAIDRYSVEKRFWHSEGDHAWAHLSASVMRELDGSPRHFVVQLQDITARRRLEQKLQHMAHFDPLTNLWNRRRFEEELQRQVSRCHRYGERAALLMIDLNGFKPINDRFGHEAGDRILVETARTLQSRLRASDALGRLGGDEFAVLLARVSADEAATLADELRGAIADVSVEADGVPLSVTASVGVAWLDEHTAGADNAMRQADTAMYDAKASRQQAASSRGADAAAESRRARREAEAGDSGPPIRVLHCDDSEAYRHLVERMLSIQPGIEMAGQAADADEAIRLASTFDGDVILLDASLERHDGRVVATLREVAPHARIIALSGMDPAHTPLGAACDGFVSKSSSFDALVKMLREARQPAAA